MKKLMTTLFSLFVVCAVNAQAVKADVQELRLTATTKAATRLFREKNDLTAVIMVVPAGSVVDVVGSDSTYFHVIFEKNDGYIYRSQAVLADPVDMSKPVVEKSEPVQEVKPAAQQEQQQSRFSYLEGKYGSGMAAKLISGKIWKGMNTEMITDSWGKPQKVNRVISGNIVKEEWIYKNTWLYLENDILIEWGPIQNQDK